MENAEEKSADEKLSELATYALKIEAAQQVT